jgi:predicted nucleic acid-binding protein
MIADSLGAAPMWEFLDTNPVVRYLVRDNVEFATRAEALIDSGRPLRLSVVTIAEIAFVLVRHYKIDRARVVDALVELLNRANIDTHEVVTEVAVEALLLCRRSGRINFADALLWAVARTAAPARVWTFDRRFPDQDIERREP